MALSCNWRLINPVQKPEPGQLFTSVEAVSTQVTISWELFSFQKKGRNPEIHPISPSLHPAAGGTAPRTHLASDTAGILQSTTALHLLLGHKCFTEGQSGNSRNFRNFLHPKESL